MANTLSRLSGFLQKRRIAHLFFAPEYEGKTPEHHLLSNSFCTVHRFPGIKPAISPNSCLAFPKAADIARICDDFEPDLVHIATEFGIGYRGMRYAVSRGLPLVISYHTDYLHYLRHHNLQVFEPLADSYLKWFHSFSHKTLVPSRYTLRQLESKDFRNLGIWSRGIDTSTFNAGYRNNNTRKSLGIGDDEFAFLYVGRLSAEKGLHMLLEATRQINKTRHRKVKFVITGGGPFEEEIRTAGLDNVILTGVKRGHELAEIYASCDCFAFPSETETFGNTPLEALASGLPVIGVENGGVTDFLTHEYNALLSKSKDREGFTDNMTRMMQNETLRRILSENAQKTARLRDWNGIFDALLYDYETVINRNTPVKLKFVS